MPAKRGYQKPVGEWNHEEIIAQGRQITVILNGATIVDADIDEASKSGTLDGKDHPGLKRDKGHIGFLGHGAKIESPRFADQGFGGELAIWRLFICGCFCCGLRFLLSRAFMPRGMFERHTDGAKCRVEVYCGFGIGIADRILDRAVPGMCDGMCGDWIDRLSPIRAIFPIDYTAIGGGMLASAEPIESPMALGEGTTHGAIRAAHATSVCQQIAWAFGGLIWGVRTQSNFVIHLVVAAAVVVAGVLLRVTLLEWCVLAPSHHRGARGRAIQHGHRAFGPGDHAPSITKISATPWILAPAPC